jgi:hypothetical protein
LLVEIMPTQKMGSMPLWPTDYQRYELENDEARVHGRGIVEDSLKIVNDTIYRIAWGTGVRGRTNFPWRLARLTSRNMPVITADTSEA